LNSYEILGVAEDANREQIKQAYHSRAKQFHPDLFTDPVEQAEAQQRMVELNLAYEKAIRQASKAKKHQVFYKVPLEQALATARRLLEQDQLESALLHLSRAEEKDADWYALQGEILMAFKEYDTAHRSFREAVRREPENMTYRSLALDAAVQVKRHQQLPMRVKDSVQALFGGGRRRR